MYIAKLINKKYKEIKCHSSAFKYGGINKTSYLCTHN